MLTIKQQLLNSRQSAAVGRQQSVGYELYADTVNNTDPLYTVQQTVGQRVTGLKPLLVVHIVLWFVTELNFRYYLLLHHFAAWI